MEEGGRLMEWWQIIATAVGVAILFLKIGRAQADNKAAHDGINQRITETNGATNKRIDDLNGFLHSVLSKDGK